MLYRVWATSVAAEDGEHYKPQVSLLDTYLSDTQKPCTQARGHMQRYKPCEAIYNKETPEVIHIPVSRGMDH